MASCSSDCVKKYPIRRRILTEKAVQNIVDWVQNESENSEYSEDSEESSSEKENEPPESGEDDDQPLINLVTPSSSSTGTSSTLHSLDEPLEIHQEDISVLPESKKRKRGRPSLDEAVTTASNSQSNSKSNNDADVKADSWKEVTGDSDSRKHEFRFLPKREPGVYASLNEDSTPIDCFFELFDREIQDELILYINEYANHRLSTALPATRGSRFKNWTPLTRYELLKFLAVIIAMGIDKRPCLEDYWSLDDVLYTPWYGEQFSRNRFEMIYSTMLHASNVDDEKEKKDKIEPFLNNLLKRFQAAYYPSQNLSLDEMVVKWKGRSKYKMYNPNKPEKYHLKTFGLCDSVTGYTFNLLIYFGNDTSYQGELDKGQSEKIFHFLMQPLGTGHHIFADRYYTTRNLIDYLSARKIYYTGTLMSNRKGFTSDMSSFKNLKHKEAKFFRCDEGILLCAWKDKKARKPVIIVSTYSKKSESEAVSKKGKVVRKPDVVHDYNFSMNGCDRMDQMLSYYNIFNRRTVKWWKRLFIWCIEVTQINAFILFCLTREEGEKPISLKDFKQKLMKGLISEADKVIPNNFKHHLVPKPRTKLVREAGPSHLIKWLPSDRNCKFCSTPNDRKRTHFFCETCNAYLHPKICFQEFHKV